MTLDEFLQSRLFGPLGMKDTHFFLPAEKVNRLAAVYRPGENGEIERIGDGMQKGPGRWSSQSQPPTRARNVTLPAAAGWWERCPTTPASPR